MHPIVAQLVARRVELGYSRERFSQISGLDRNSLRTHESVKFPGLAWLDRWARALGYELRLAPIDESGAAGDP